MSTPDDVCLIRYSDQAEAPSWVQRVGSIYFDSPPTVHYVAGAPDHGEVAILAHEICHAHQDRVARDAGFAPFTTGWYRTAAGTDFIRTTGWRLERGRWVENPEPLESGLENPLEDNAQICAVWFDPARGPWVLRRWAPLRFAWAQRWLPLPTFVHPWLGPSPTPVAE